MNTSKEMLRKIPSIEQLLVEMDEGVQAEQDNRKISHEVRVQLLREATQKVRRTLLGSRQDSVALINEDEVRKQIGKEYSLAVHMLFTTQLKRVVNATGIVLHTNLGRAPLGQRARQCVNDVMDGYCTLEYDLANGQRGERYSHVEKRLCALTGAEAALVVNNNAASVLLALSSIARDREVIVSRGELVEIGGSFRIPDVIRQSGAILIEVGTTNKTHLYDYSAAISERTAAILKVHPSNFHMSGFTSRADEEQLCKLACAKGVVSINDVGSGTLLPVGKGSCSEPTVQECLRAGFNLVTFSGDKLLGAGQAGLIVGQSKLIDKIKREPLLRAVRIDKLSLAALEGTLIDYMSGMAREQIPLWRLLSQKEHELKAKAESLALKCKPVRVAGWEIQVVETASLSGGGALPDVEIPSYAVEIVPRGEKVSGLVRQLRLLERPIICLVREDALILDVRCLWETEFDYIGNQIAKLPEQNNA